MYYHKLTFKKTCIVPDVQSMGQQFSHTQQVLMMSHMTNIWKCSHMYRIIIWDLSRCVCNMGTFQNLLCIQELISHILYFQVTIIFQCCQELGNYFCNQYMCNTSTFFLQFCCSKYTVTQSCNSSLMSHLRPIHFQNKICEAIIIIIIPYHSPIFV